MAFELKGTNFVKYPVGDFVVAVHENRFDTSVYLFRVTEGSRFSSADFIQFLGDDYEPNSDEALTLKRFKDDEVKVV